MNIKNVMMMAAMMPAVALAETNSNSAPASVEANDTTIRVNDQNIVIKQDGEQTSVKIYKMNGNEMTKISETQFVDGQEVEKVFVTSPFIPQTLSKRKRSLESHYPTFFFGCSQLPGSRGSMGGNNEMHSRDSKSWEWGITLTSLCFRLSNEMALTSSLSIGQVHHHFKDNYVLISLKKSKKMPEYHKRGSRNTTHMLFQNPKNRRTFAASIRTNSLMPIMTG